MTLFPIIVEHDYQVGDKVSGHDCLGQAFSGHVSGTAGRFSLMVDGVFTPLVLIDGYKAHKTPPKQIGQIELPKPVAGGVFD